MIFSIGVKMGLSKRRHRPLRNLDPRRRRELAPLEIPIPLWAPKKKKKEGLSQLHRIMLVEYRKKDLPDGHPDKECLMRMLARVDRMGKSARERVLRYLIRSSRRSLFQSS